MHKAICNPAFPAAAGILLGLLLVLLSTPIAWTFSADAAEVIAAGVRLAFYGPLLTVLWLVFGGLAVWLSAALSR